jgi:hypothetical protein
VLVSAVRGYLSSVLLGVAAVVLLVLGAPAKAALAGAGFALIGAAVTRGIDLAKERRAEAAKTAADRRRDLDETRRLAYAMLSTRTMARDPLIVATIVNALAHHGLGADPDVATEHIYDEERHGEGERWLRE